ncbi:homocysteine S-methyltransferase family protein [Capillimicrobium parvum]|uniref:Homocysteine S-methyltransferase n=1 Tax=Capillimicrobium parvum TaxID=2884022 RepID=A0A9E6XW89_9ACTN|nr:homocysteine S-methyltransferase family protein [Capillimicrobium parvum]UGS35621.1 Homocysteine S-methyltransferase [Capillimicrobium parvum]
MVEQFEQRLAAGEVVLIDGGTGTELEARGVPMNGSVWCGVAVLDHQDVVRGVHEDYIRAGAEVIVANTFPSNRLALEPAGFGDRVAEINRRAVETARQARENAADRAVLVAGSLSPHSAEGIPDPQPGADTVLAAFREQVAIQAEAGVDLFALEMIPDAFYGRAATQAALESGLPVWLGMTSWSGDGGWQHEDGLGNLVAALARPGVMAVNAMHTDVEQIAPAVEEIRQHWDGVLGAYAHHGGWEPPNWIFHDISPEDYAQAALGWVQQGVQIIGGCCGIRPAHIALLRERLPARIPAG